MTASTYTFNNKKTSIMWIHRKSCCFGCILGVISIFSLQKFLVISAPDKFSQIQENAKSKLERIRKAPDRSEILNDFKLNPSSLNNQNSAKLFDLNVTIADYTTMSRNQCFAKYGDRSFLLPVEARLPPILYTFPGSGNTWGRLLIEHATGIFTGSVYNDKTLIEALPGEYNCDHNVSVIKVHPHTHSFDELNSGFVHSDKEKCANKGITKFERAVLLIRNPYDSIWSEYQRRLTQSHVQGILKKGFDWPRWQANAAALSHAYHNTFTRDYAGIERVYGPGNILYVRYESLKDKSTRIDALGKVAAFLKRPASDERLHCAFVLSESEKAHRAPTDTDMTKALAYTKPLACRMWALFGAKARRHDYHLWDGDDASCTTPDGKRYEPIPMINVGAKGEYNFEWVSNGGKLFDLGGHEAFDKMMTQDKRSMQSEEGSPDRPSKGDRMIRRQQRKIKKQLKIDGKPPGGASRAPPTAAATAGSSGSTASSMTVAESQSIAGVGRVGDTKPAWQD